MVEAVFNNQYDTATVTGLWQWDYGQVLRIVGLDLPAVAEVHFSLQEHGGDASIVVGTTKDGVTEVKIPKFILEGNRSSMPNRYFGYAFIYLQDGESGETKYVIRLSIKARPKPQDYTEPEDEEVFGQVIEEVNKAAERAEAAADEAVNAAESVAPEIADNGNWVILGKDTGKPSRGEKGEQGKDGADGKDGEKGKAGVDGIDGITPHIGDNNHWYIGETDTGVLAEGKDGAPGKDGADGLPGRDGADGKDGRDGEPGKDGEPGVQGPPGKDGADGKDGETGPAGPPGTTMWEGITDKPSALPNPNPLEIKMDDTATLYDGTEKVSIEIPSGEKLMGQISRTEQYSVSDALGGVVSKVKIDGKSTQETASDIVPSTSKIIPIQSKKVTVGEQEIELRSLKPTGNLWDLKLLGVKANPNIKKEGNDIQVQAWASNETSLFGLFKPNTTYSIRVEVEMIESANAEGRTAHSLNKRLAFYSSSGGAGITVFHDGNELNNGETVVISNTFTTPSSFDGYMLLLYSERYLDTDNNAYLSKVKFKNITLAEGSTKPTTYVAPTIRDYLIVDATAQTIKVERNVGQYLYKDGDKWGLYDGSGAYKYGYYMSILNMAASKRIKTYCNILQTVSTSEIETPESAWVGSNNNALYAVKLPDAFDTTDKWKTFMEENNFEVLYPLATPAEEALTYATGIASTSGESWQDTESPSPTIPSDITNVTEVDITVQGENVNQPVNLKIPLSDPLRSIPSGACDTLENEITTRIKEITLTGSEKWTLELDSGEYIRFYTQVSDKALGTINLMCTHFEVSKSVSGMNIIAGRDNNKAVSISIDKRVASDLDSFKAWLSSNQVKVQYELADPIVEETQQEILEQLKKLELSYGDNTVICNTPISMEYQKSIQLAIDNILSLLKSQA